MDYSCVGSRPLVALTGAAFRFPKIVIVFASLLALGLFYPTRHEQSGFACLFDCDLALPPGQSIRLPTVSIAPVTLFIQITFETAGYVITVCVTDGRHRLCCSQAANA